MTNLTSEDQHTSNSALWDSDVVGVIEDLFGVGSDVDCDGEALGGLDSSQRRVQREFAHGNSHAVGAQVA